MNTKVSHTPGLRIESRKVCSSDGHVVCESGLWDVTREDGTVLFPELSRIEACAILDLFEDLVALSDLACNRGLSHRKDHALKRAIEDIQRFAGKSFWELRSDQPRAAIAKATNHCASACEGVRNHGRLDSNTNRGRQQCKPNSNNSKKPCKA